jgi:hypothetical protein
MGLPERTLYWFLEVAVRHRVSIDALLPGTPPDPDHVLDHFALVFNREPHGLGPAELEGALFGLFRDGLLLACNGVRSAFDPDPDGFTPTREQVRAALAPRPGAVDTPLLYYGLSAAGGERWERFARPDWMRFVDHEEGPFGVVSHPRPRLEVQLISQNRTLVAAKWEADRDAYRIADGATFGEDALRPWDATYWKRLPEGWQVRYLLWREAELRARGAVIGRYRHMDAVSFEDPHDRWGPDWYADPFTGRPMR